MRRVRRFSIVWILVCLLMGVGGGIGRAQADDVLWSEPVNLSRSGAAEAPVLVASPPNKTQVFWWDRFDGMMTSYTTGNGRWSASKEAPVQIVEVEGDGAAARVVTSTLTAMPQLVGTGEEVLALWLGRPEPETEARPLLTSRLRVGTSVWSSPETIAESAIDWAVTVDPQGDVHLVYRQPQSLEGALAGIYYLHSADAGTSWSTPAVLHSSAYVRLWTDETIHLTVVADGLGNVLAGWDDPRQGTGFYSHSDDNGVSWTEPVEAGSREMPGQHVQFAFLPSRSRNKARSEVLMLWEQGGAVSTCALMQQHSGDGGQSWSETSQALRDLTACPAHFAASSTADGQLLAILDEGTDHLLLAIWNGEQWSRAKSLSLSFEDVETGTTNYLAALQACVIDDHTLAVVGLGQDAEVWTLQGQIDFGEWAFAPPSPWSDLSIVAESNAHLDFPAVATDAEGNVHVMWAAALTVDQPDTALFYSRWDRTAWSSPVAVLESGEGVAQSPSLAFSGEFLHAVWSSGPTGTVFYSRTYPQDAYVASSWSTPQMLGAMDMGSSPAITVDLLGQLHVVFAVPLNEGRGVYYARSDDNGESWHEVVRVFDAVAAHWPSVVCPDVTVDEQGIIHIVWLRAPLPGNGLPYGVYYARSTDRGTMWSEAELIAEGAYDWPQVAATLTGQIVISWQDLNRGIAQYRISSDYGATWDYVSQIPGLQAVEGRAVLASDTTGQAHLVALDTEADTGAIVLLHLIFDEGRWSQPDSVQLEDDFMSVGGAISSVAGELGLIDVVGVGSQRREAGPISVLWHTYRGLEKRAAQQPSFALELTPTPMPGPTPTLPPTPRPTVLPNPPQPSTPVLALGPLSLPVLALGGIGIALLLVSGAVMLKVTKR